MTPRVGLGLSLFDSLYRAADLLEPANKSEIIDFLRGRMSPDGVFEGRSSEGDLYYTVFGVASLLALGDAPPVERLRKYLDSFGDGEGLDFVHLTCLTRLWALLGLARVGSDRSKRRAVRLAKWAGKWGRPSGGAAAVLPGKTKRALARRIEESDYASYDSGSIYSCFLAFQAREDLGERLPDADAISRCVARLRTPDGAYADTPGVEQGTTTVTAAAVVLSHFLGPTLDREAVRWLADRAHPQGGFRAGPLAPAPDLLSTAAALHAFRTIGEPVESKRANFEFIESLWDESGGFRGHLLDSVADCEYTFYGLLALGALAR